MRVQGRYRAKDSISWLVETGFFDQTPDMMPSSEARFKAHPFLTGKDGGHSLAVHQVARDGVVLLGHMSGAEGTRITLAPDLQDNLAAVDQFVVDFEHGIDALIEKCGLDAAEVKRLALRVQSLQFGASSTVPWSHSSENSSPTIVRPQWVSYNGYDLNK